MGTQKSQSDSVNSQRFKGEEKAEGVEEALANFLSEDEE